MFECLEGAFPADAEVESARLVVVRIGGQRNAVVQAKRADGQLQTHANADVVVVSLRFAGKGALSIRSKSPRFAIFLARSVQIFVIGGKAEGVFIDHADVVEHSESEAFDDRHTVFSGGKPAGFASDGFARSVFGADVAEAKAAKGIQSAEETSVKERHAVGVSVFFDDADLRLEFEDVAFGEAFEVVFGAKVDFVKVGVAAKGAAGNVGSQAGKLADVGQTAGSSSIVVKDGADFGDQTFAFLFFSPELIVIRMSIGDFDLF